MYSFQNDELPKNSYYSQKILKKFAPLKIKSHTGIEYIC